MPTRPSPINPDDATEPDMRGLDVADAARTTIDRADNAALAARKVRKPGLTTCSACWGAEVYDPTTGECAFCDGYGNAKAHALPARRATR